MYSQKTIELFKNPQHAGSIENASSVAEVGNVKCGDIIKVYLDIKDNIVKDIKFETYGCVAAIAASEQMCRMVVGKTVEEAENLNWKDILDKLEDMPQLKHHCSILGTESLQKALKQHKKAKE